MYPFFVLPFYYNKLVIHIVVYKPYLSTKRYLNVNTFKDSIKLTIDRKMEKEIQENTDEVESSEDFFGLDFNIDDVFDRRLLEFDWKF